MKKLLLLSLLFSLELFAKRSTFYYRGGEKVFLTPILSTARVSNAQVQYYKVNDKVNVGVSNKLIIKFYDTAKLQEVLKEFHLTIVKKLFQNTFLLQCETQEQTLFIANTLTQMPQVQYAHPDFIQKSFKR